MQRRRRPTRRRSGRRRHEHSSHSSSCSLFRVFLLGAWRRGMEFQNMGPNERNVQSMDMKVSTDRVGPPLLLLMDSSLLA
jgi:hypothetical protein